MDLASFAVVVMVQLVVVVDLDRKVEVLEIGSNALVQPGICVSQC